MKSRILYMDITRQVSTHGYKSKIYAEAIKVEEFYDDQNRVIDRKVRAWAEREITDTHEQSHYADGYHTKRREQQNASARRRYADMKRSEK
jgi:hypothetical protein